MNKQDLQRLEDTLLSEYRDHKQHGGFDVHAAAVTRLFELLYLTVQHLNSKPGKKKR